MKKCLTLLLGLSLCLPAISTTASAASMDIKVNVEGDGVVFDQPPLFLKAGHWFQFVRFVRRSVQPLNGMLVPGLRL